jgi:hypothetical protein
MSPRFLTRLLICFVVSGANSHCRPVAKQPVNRSFYYWKSVFALSADERNELSALQVTRMYVRFFDVTWDRQTGMAVPTASIRFKDTIYPGYNVIPVVFISNEVFSRLDSLGVAVLAASTAALVRQLGDDNHLPQPDEIQLDCDWTAATRVKYFSFLTNIRRVLNEQGQQSCQLSATIRLYQAKYEEVTGVPPVVKGLLMCYNMGDRKNTKTHNSILETTELQKYIGQLSSYPLPLDVALPIFDWKVLFHDGHYSGLVESLPTANLLNTAVTRSANQYLFQRDTVLNGYSFQAGDLLRDEQTDYHTLITAADLVSSRLRTIPNDVILFHFDSTNLSKYSTNELAHLYNCFN